MHFRDRSEAGRELARAVVALDLASPLVLGLPRGGVPVAFEVALALQAPLDVIVARKVGAPGHRELGIGAVAEGGTVVRDERSIQALGLADEAFGRLLAAEEAEVERAVRRFRGDRPLPGVEGRDVLVVDDGLATGVTAEAALRAVRAGAPRRLVLAAPVCAADTARRLEGLADDVVCVAQPVPFHAVGRFYERFDQTTDDEVLDLLAQMVSRHRST